MELGNKRRIGYQLNCCSIKNAICANVTSKNLISKKSVCFSCSTCCSTFIYINLSDKFIPFFLNISVGKTSFLNHPVVLSLLKSDSKQCFFAKKRYLSQNSSNNTNRYDKTHNHIDRLAVSVRGIGVIARAYCTKTIRQKGFEIYS